MIFVTGDGKSVDIPEQASAPAIESIPPESPEPFNWFGFK